ncbi:hypothetical protein MMC11_005766 [Xylographa trunciseda]|nr:hypothetical protein [Xylographa trunciseda]
MRTRFSQRPISHLRSRLRRQVSNSIRPRPFNNPFSTILTPETSQASVPVGLNGSFSLIIHHPPRPSAVSPILVHLPRGPLDLPIPPPPLAPLARAANATVVSLDYRLSASAQYPTPVHDVAAGYDWVVKHLVHGSAAHNGWQSPGTRLAPVAVCGELLGGSLAAMLALTECHAHKSGSIKALVLGAPVVDWTAMYAVTSISTAEDTTTPGDQQQATSDSTPITKPKPSKRKPPHADSWLTHASNPLLSASTLLQARDALFAKPEHYHDPFASPLLFFRTASSDIPLPENILAAYFASSAPAASADSPEATAAFLKPRRAHRRYPPLGSGLLLPRTRIDVGAGSVLRDQGVELAEAMRRSWMRYGGRGAGTGRGGSPEREDGQGEGEENVQLRVVEGEGLWGEEELVGVGRWVAETLGRGEARHRRDSL